MVVYGMCVAVVLEKRGVFQQVGLTVFPKGSHVGVTQSSLPL